MTVSEKSFENKIKSLLKAKGCYFIKYWGGGHFTKVGVPDILCCCKARFIGIEVKAANGKLSPLQQYNLKQIDEAGGYALLVYPKDWATFQEFMLCLQNEKVATADYIYRQLKERWA